MDAIIMSGYFTYTVGITIHYIYTQLGDKNHFKKAYECFLNKLFYIVDSYIKYIIDV